MNKIFKTMALAIISIIAGVATILPVEASAQKEAENGENTVTAIKIKTLNNRKAELKNKIAIEDKKRGRAADGVSAETMEQMNDVQDSICLSLRSDLVDVELELSELTPDETQNKIVKQYKSLKESQSKENKDSKK